jgi:phage terminase small subunit
MTKKNDGDETNVVQIKKGNKPAPDKLTGKQTQFVQGVLRGLSQSDAYREAYSAENMSDKATWTEASKLFSHPVVSQRIAAGRKRQEDSAVHSAATLRSHIQKTLYDMTTEGNTDQAKLRGCELLGKLTSVSAFTERVEQVTDCLTSAPMEQISGIA